MEGENEGTNQLKKIRILLESLDECLKSEGCEFDRNTAEEGSDELRTTLHQRPWKRKLKQLLTSILVEVRHCASTLSTLSRISSRYMSESLLFRESDSLD